MVTILTYVFESLYITIITFGAAIIVWDIALTFYSLMKLEFSRLKHKSIYCKREVVLTLVSPQLGSRHVRYFVYDKLNQVFLGTWVSSFVYCRKSHFFLDVKCGV